MLKKVWKGYFSPSGTTEIIVEKISNMLAISKETYLLNLLKEPIVCEQLFDSHCLVIVGIPVFVWRILEFCAKQLEMFKGNQTPVIATVT